MRFSASVLRASCHAIFGNSAKYYKPIGPLKASLSFKASAALWVLAISLSLPSQSALAQTTPTYVAGAMAGEVGVSPSGGATYSVAIVVPPGTTGVQPKVALQYNSQGGNGVAGVGWSIAGLSTITRCGTDLYYDGSIDPVDYDGNDKFCLNGQRLVAVNGAYGANGTEYRTSFASFQKVVSYGHSGNGPAWFRVWKKNGEIFDYGGTADSRVIRPAPRTDIRAWALSRIADVKGNYVKYSYVGNRTVGAFNVSRIDYTGNDLQGLAPYNSVRFSYETRPDKIVAYHFGDRITLSKRLTSIKVYAGPNLARDYRIEYGAGGTGRSRPVKITECATATVCFRPTTFDWSNEGTVSFPPVNIAGAYKVRNNYGVVISGDFNGDGLTDFYTAHKKADGRFEYVAGHQLSYGRCKNH